MGSDRPSHPGADTIFAAEFSKPSDIPAFKPGDNAEVNASTTSDTRANDTRTESTTAVKGDGSQTQDKNAETAGTVPLRQTTLEVLGFFDKRWNHLGTLDTNEIGGDRRVSEPQKRLDQNREALDFRPPNERDKTSFNETFFVLPTKKDQNATGDLGSLTPPVQLLDANNSLPLEIRDEKGRLLAGEKETKVSDWSNFVERNKESGEIEVIRYPDGKIRHFKHQTGNVARIETLERAADGTIDRSVLTKNPTTGKWYAEIGGIPAELPGKVELSKDGVLSFQLDGEGKWRTERPDATSAIERTNIAGARIAYNPDNSIQQVTRPDNSRVEFVRKAGELTGVKEIGADGKQTVWTKTDGKWISNSQPPQQRKDISVSENGNVSFVSTDGVTTTRTGAGLDLIQKADGSSCQFDADGRFTDLKDANGLRVKGITYVGKTDQVARVQISNSQSGKTFTYERDGTSNTWKYTVTDGSGNVLIQDRWSGDIKIAKDGTYSYKEDTQQGRNGDGMWHTFKLDGTQTLVQDNGAGSRATYDLNKNLISVERANGTSFEIKRENGAVAQVIERQRGGDVVNYKPEGGLFVPDKQGHKPLKTITAELDGSVNITDVNGSQHKIKLDGSKVVKNDDGSTAQVDSNGLVQSTTSKKGDVTRTFNYDNGKLVSVNEQRKSGQNIESRSITGKDISVSDSGTVRFTDQDGKNISTTSDGSWQMLDAKGLVVKTVSPNGSSRTFVRDEAGECTKIIDSRRTSQGERFEEWNRVKENGKFTDTFAMLKADGKIDARHNVRVLDDGNYSYIDNNGKDKLAKVGGRGWELGEPITSATIDDARANFNEVMEANMQDPERLKRLQILMNKFEQRMSERLECRVAAGEAPEQCGEEIEAKVAKAYDNLSELVMNEPTGDSAFAERARRVTLAEQFMMHAQDTTLMNQGSNGTCWIQAGHIIGMVNHPDHMSRLLKEVALTGSFTTLNNGERDSNPRTVRFSKRLFAYGGRDEEAHFTINSPYQNGTRGPVGMIFDQVLPVIGGRREGQSNAGNYGGSDGARRIMYMVTGDVVYDSGHKLDGSDRATFLKKGGFITYAPGHMRTQQLKKIDGEWYVLQDDQHGPQGDRVLSKIKDLRQWLSERPGRVQIHRPPGIGGNDTVGPTNYPVGPYNPGDDGGCPGGDCPRPGGRIIRWFIRRRWR